MTSDLFNRAREAQAMLDSMLSAVRRNDVQAARALGRQAMTSIELAMRELPDALNEARAGGGR
jgi:hypothetical protein